MTHDIAYADALDAWMDAEDALSRAYRRHRAARTPQTRAAVRAAVRACRAASKTEIAAYLRSQVSHTGEWA